MPSLHEYPNSSLVRIFKEGAGTVGLGLLVDDEHVLTCAHVVARALNLPDETQELPEMPVELDFPYLGKSAPLQGKAIH